MITLQGAPTTNAGTQTRLYVDGGVSDLVSWLKFNLSAIPLTATVTSAVLNLASNFVDLASPNPGTNPRRITATSGPQTATEDAISQPATDDQVIVVTPTPTPTPTISPASNEVNTSPTPTTEPATQPTATPTIEAQPTETLTPTATIVDTAEPSQSNSEGG